LQKDGSGDEKNPDHAEGPQQPRGGSAVGSQLEENPKAGR